jgi:putative two-component system response regulator
VFLTAHTDDKVEAQGFELGAVDFIAKPFSEAVLLNRITTHLNIDGLIKKRTERIQQLYNGILSIVANMVESRDAVTGGHIERTSRYLEVLITEMLKKGIYKDELSSWDIETAVSSARLHDIGKITVRDAVLNKPGKLTPEEFGEIKLHTTEGVKMIDRIIAIIGDEPFLQSAKSLAGYHHERWDGNGYPYGLKEYDIPLQGRILAVADVYDALVSKRPNKEAFPIDKAENIINDDSGVFFDPLIVEVFNEKKKDFAEIASQYR